MSGEVETMLSRRQALAWLMVGAGCAFAQNAAAKRPPITAAVFAPPLAAEPTQVVIASQAGIEVLAYPQLTPLRRLNTKMAHIHDLKFAGENLLIAAGGYPAEGGVLELFSWPAGERQFSEQLHDDVIYAVAIEHPLCVTAGGDSLAKIFDVIERRVVTTFDGHSRPILAAAMLAGGQTAITAGIDESLRVWNPRTGEQARTLHNHRAAVRAMALRPPGSTKDGNAAADLPVVASAGADRTVRFWQPTIGRMMRFVELPVNPLAIAWSFDGSRLLAACEDGAVRALDPETAKIIDTHPALEGWAHTLCMHPSHATALVGGPDGRVVAVNMAQ